MLFNCLRPITNATTILRTRQSLKLPDRQVILTFDDGPETANDNTNRLLDMLGELSVKACFCVVGEQVERAPAVFNRIYNEEHLVANHFHTHRMSALLSVRSIRQEIQKCDRAMAKALDVPAYRSVAMRPPGGVVSPALRSVIAEDDLQLMCISHYAYDTRRNAPRVVKSILKDARKNRGGVYVLHDGMYSLGGRHKPDAQRGWVVNAVKQIVQTLRNEGYEFASPHFLLKLMKSNQQQFREITASDIPAIFDVRVATWHNDNGHQEMTEMGITPETVKTMLDSTHRGWLCEVDGQVVGFAMGNIESGEMWVIAVLKEYECRGIGKQLLNRVEQWLFDNDWSEIWLTTDLDESMRAVQFYRSQGWTDWKVADGDRFMRKTRNVN